MELEIEEENIFGEYGDRYSDMHLVYTDNKGAKLFLGDIFASKNLEQLKNNGIKSICSVCPKKELRDYPEEEGYSHKIIAVQDCKKERLIEYMDEGVQWISDHMQNSNVLVHCLAGVSRSATIAAAFLVKTLGIEPKIALRMLQDKRDIVHPNVGFLNQLDEYYDRLNSGGNSNIQLSRED